MSCMTVGAIYIVSPDPTGGWQVSKGGTTVRRGIDTKQQAVAKARQFADRNDTVTVQGSSGEFQRWFNPRS